MGECIEDSKYKVCEASEDRSVREAEGEGEWCELAKSVRNMDEKM